MVHTRSSGVHANREEAHGMSFQQEHAQSGDSRVRELPPRDIALQTGNVRERTFRWDLALVWFMRLVAVLWLAKGLAYWAILLGVLPWAGPFEDQPLQWQSAVVYFAVIDLVAAVGLWLTSSWGGVIWLMAAMSYFLAVFVASHAVVSTLPVLVTLGVLVVAYFLLSWQASRIET